MKNAVSDRSIEATSKATRLTLLGLAVAVALISISLTACSLIGGPKSPPPYLEKAAIHIKILPLKKTKFAESESFGTVSDLAVDADVVALAGSAGGAYLSKAGEVQSTVKFDNLVANVVLIPPRSQGEKFRFLDRGGWGSPSTLFDPAGKTKWKAKEKDGVDDAAYGALPDNPRGKFVVGYNGGSGVSLLDENGKELWVQSDGNVWHVEITSPAKSSDARIVHSNAAGKLTVRDGSGNVVRQVKPPFYFSDFSLCRYPKKSDDQCLLSCEDGKIWLLDQDGVQVDKLPLPINEGFGEAHGTLVRLNPSKPDCLATIIAWNTFKRSLLCVHDHSGKLVYAEVLPEFCGAIAAMPEDDSKPETLLIGGTGTVWKYSSNSESSPSKDDEKNDESTTPSDH